MATAIRPLRGMQSTGTVSIMDGVLEYVLVDDRALRGIVLTGAPGGYQECKLGPGDVYRTSFLPGLVLALDGVLPRGGS